MNIVENLAEWKKEFGQGWLAHLRQTGETYWKIYAWPHNGAAPAGPGIDLAQSRLMFITTAGVYLRDSQEPFDAASKIGDYSIRTFSPDTPFSDLAIAHDHYDHTAVNRDPQVLLPFQHLRQMTAEGVIGELAPSVISFCGYQPDVSRVIDEMIPEILAIAQAEKVDGALLVPA